MLACGSETWVLTKSDEAILGVFERKILRAIFGPTNDNGEWLIKYNNELYTLYKKKGKGKGRFMGLFNTAAVRPIVFLPPTNSRIHLQRRHVPYRCARTLPAKAGTITHEFC